MNHEVEQVVLRELDPGEKLLWTGMPQKGILFRWYDYIFIPAGICTAIFAIVNEAFLIWKGAPAVMIIVGLPFVLIGLTVLFGRFIINAKIREKTFYGVTDKRVIIISGFFNKMIKSADFTQVRNLSLVEGKNRKGTISFGAYEPYFASKNLISGLAEEPQFEMIENARDVYDIIVRARKFYHA
jgi:hypothetical protein